MQHRHRPIQHIAFYAIVSKDQFYLRQVGTDCALLTDKYRSESHRMRSDHIELFYLVSIV